MIGRALAVASVLTGGAAGASVVVNPHADESVRRRETAALALQAGLAPELAVTAVAIAEGESHHRDAAEGDTTITDSTWGPSYGRWQIRCLWAEVGTGATRDCTRLNDPLQNARSMFVVSGGGETWRPWSVYTSGAYRQYLSAATVAVAEASGTRVVAGEPVGAAVQGVKIERTPKRLGANVWAMLMDRWSSIGRSDNPEVRERWTELDKALFGTTEP